MFPTRAAPLFCAVTILAIASSAVAAKVHHGLSELLHAEEAPADSDSSLRHGGWSRKGSQSLLRKEIRLPTIRVGDSVSRAKPKKGGKHTSFTGVPDYIRRRHNITRLSHMLYRVIHQYRIQSMVDVPCRAHSRWMGRFLENITLKKGEPFRYYCVDSSAKILELAESRIPVLKGVSTNFIHRKFWKLPMPRADLVFAWEGPEKMRTENVQSMLKLIAEGDRHKYFLVGSSPSVKKNSKKHELNIRRAPFSYNLPNRIFKELAVDASPSCPEKHMYMYVVAEMRKAK